VISLPAVPKFSAKTDVEARAPPQHLEAVLGCIGFINKFSASLPGQTELHTADFNMSTMGVHYKGGKCLLGMPDGTVCELSGKVEQLHVEVVEVREGGREGGREGERE
jgi:hypothetical protein